MAKGSTCLDAPRDDRGFMAHNVVGLLKSGKKYNRLDDDDSSCVLGWWFRIRTEPTTGIVISGTYETRAHTGGM
jgi:hypothetical protein